MPEEKLPVSCVSLPKRGKQGMWISILPTTPMTRSLTHPFGTLKVKRQLRAMLPPCAKNMKDMKVTETGNGIIVHGG